MSETPVFIVGIQRSGTTLLAAILAAHSKLSCGPETHFFRHLSKIEPGYLTEPATWPEGAVEFIDSINHNSFSPDETITLLEKYRLEKSQITNFLNARSPSIAAVLESITEQYMTEMGKVRWVEKTPDHINHLALVRKYFPESLIIRIVRDPRDVALSLLNVPWGAKTLLEAYLYWKNLDDASREFFMVDKNSYTLRYEDLVSSPEQSMQVLCDRIGVEYEPAMLDTSRTGKLINRRNVPWKDAVSQSINSSRVAVWRTGLTGEQNKLAEAVLGDRMEAYKYPIESKFDRLGVFYPVSILSSKYFGLQGLVESGGVRFWSAYPGEEAKVVVYLGDPGSKEWIKNTGRFSLLIKIIAGMIKSIFTRGSVFWLADQNSAQWSGYVAFLIKLILSPYRLKG